MKKCSYCGAEYPDDVLACVIDNRPLERSIEPPPAEREQTEPRFQPIAAARVRGGWLTGFVIVGFLASMYYLCMFLGHWEQMSAAMPTWAVVISRTVVFLRPVTFIAIWLWSRTGVLGYIILSVLTVAEAVALGLTMPLIGIVGIIVLVAVVRQKWHYMTWGISAYPKVPEAELTEVPEW